MAYLQKCVDESFYKKNLQMSRIWQEKYVFCRWVIYENNEKLSFDLEGLETYRDYQKMRLDE